MAGLHLVILQHKPKTLMDQPTSLLRTDCQQTQPVYAAGLSTPVNFRRLNQPVLGSRPVRVAETESSKADSARILKEALYAVAYVILPEETSKRSSNEASALKKPQTIWYVISVATAISNSPAHQLDIFKCFDQLDGFRLCDRLLLCQLVLRTHGSSCLEGTAIFSSVPFFRGPRTIPQS